MSSIGAEILREEGLPPCRKQILANMMSNIKSFREEIIEKLKLIYEVKKLKI